jgi:hypothetical protein
MSGPIANVKGVALAADRRFDDLDRSAGRFGNGSGTIGGVIAATICYNNNLQRAIDVAAQQALQRRFDDIGLVVGGNDNAKTSHALSTPSQMHRIARPEALDVSLLRDTPPPSYRGLMVTIGKSIRSSYEYRIS